MHWLWAAMWEVPSPVWPWLYNRNSSSLLPEAHPFPSQHNAAPCVHRLLSPKNLIKPWTFPSPPFNSICHSDVIGISSPKITCSYTEQQGEDGRLFPECQSCSEVNRGCTDSSATAFTQTMVATQAYKKGDKKTSACVLREEGLPRHFSRVTVVEKIQASDSRSALNKSV